MTKSPEPRPSNPSPKARFLNDRDLHSAHRTFTESESLQRCFDYALLSYMARLSALPMNESGATHFRIMGAQEFIQEFRKLSATELTPQIVDGINLPHRT